MKWNPSFIKPRRPGVYLVDIPLPARDAESKFIDARYARWTGAYWTSWAITPQRAAQCEWRGPSAGYRWALIPD